MSREERAVAWEAWLTANLHASPDVTRLAAETALDAVDRGLGRYAAAIAAYTAVGWTPDPAHLEGLRQEQTALEELLATLPTLPLGNGLTAAGVAQLQRLLETRLDEQRRLASAVAAPGAADRPALPAPADRMAHGRIGKAAAGVENRRERGPAFSMQGYLSEHGILVLSYVGGFLLVVATLLFEVYGTTGAEGVVRLSAVVLLTIFFANAGRLGVRSTRLRLVGRSYIAVAALLTPLDFAAAYSFLVLRRYGVSPAATVAVAGIACTGLYGTLATQLRSTGYAHIAMVALAVAWAGTLEALGAGRWAGAWFAVIGALYVIASNARVRLTSLGLWRPRAAWYVHLAGVLAAAWTIARFLDLELAPAMRYMAVTLTVAALAYALQAFARPSRFAASMALGATSLAWLAALYAVDLGVWRGPAVIPLAGLGALLSARPGLVGGLGPSIARPARVLVALAAALAILVAADQTNGWPMTVTLAGLSVILALSVLVPHQRRLAVVPAVAISATVLQASLPLHLPPEMVALALVALAWGYVLACDLPQTRAARRLFLAGAAVQAAAVAGFTLTPHALAATMLAAAASVGIAIAVRDGQPNWLAVSTPLLALSWFATVVAVVPVPNSAGPSDLVRAYAPLPVVYAIAALAVRRRFGRKWMRPIAISAGLVAAAVCVGASGSGDYATLGWALLLYSLGVYVFAVLERSGAAAAAAGPMLGTAVLALLRSGGAPSGFYPVAMVVVSAGFYLLHLEWREFGRSDPPWLMAHRAAGLGGAALASLAGLATLPDPAGAPALAGVTTSLGLGLLLLLDARLYDQPLLEYAAGLSAVATIYWIDHYLGLTNPQFYLGAMGLVVLCLGVAAGRDRRVRLDPRVPVGTIAAGLALVLGTTLLQSLNDPVPWLFTVLALAQSTSALITGVGLRSRALVIGGAVGVAVASLRALVLLQQQFPLWMVFGLVALLLLVVAGALAMVRDQLISARSSLGRSWQEWD
ncbi:MAG: hypothetical protein ABR598_02400 [Candidatus Dormibacteria bacterium]